MTMLPNWRTEASDMGRPKRIESRHFTISPSLATPYVATSFNWHSGCFTKGPSWRGCHKLRSRYRENAIATTGPPQSIDGSRI